MSLRLRLTLIYSLFLAVVLAVVASTVYALTQRSIVGAIEDRADRLASTLFTELKGDSASRDALKAKPREAFFFYSVYFEWPEDIGEEGLQTPVLSQTGTDLGNVNPAGPSAQTILSEVLANAAFRRSVVESGRGSVQVTLPEGQSFTVRAVSGTVTVGRGFLPAVYYVALPLELERLSQLKVNLIRTVLGAFVLFTVGVWLMSKLVLTPVKRVTRVAEQVSVQDLSQRVPVPNTHDEVTELAMTLNKMLDRLQESFETQRRFTADASHELRTPVTAIVGHSNYLLRRTQPSAKQVDSLTVIKHEGERMAKLVNDLLELARADAGFTVELNPSNLVEIIESVHMEVAPVAGETQISVSIPQPHIEVIADAARLKQVLLNLVHNALNAGAKHITLSAAKERKQVRIEVLDDGPGIPSEAIPHLFERFYRVDGARSTRGNGSGLGLAIVRWIVQQHGGEVEVQSRIGEGTVFSITLPIIDVKQTEVRQSLVMSPST